MSPLKDFRGLEGSNFFEMDPGFQSLLSESIPDDARKQIFESLTECGGRVAGPWDELAREASRHENLPRIIKLDRVGNPVEQVDFGALSRKLRREVAEFGVLTQASSELHKFALVYLLAHNGEAGMNCGLSCTDGLIRVIEAKGSDFLRQTYLPQLRSIDTPLAGAQFVTEQSGGSDVGAIESVATPAEDGTWSITGEKWFCSNPDEFYLVAARVAGAQPGTRGIGIFLVPRVLPDGRLNSVCFVRLKNKLGTQSLPTAEMAFNGATGFAIGDPADGFKTLMNYVINVSRVHNAANACGFLHRAFIEARNYARQRIAFGNPLASYPLIRQTLITMLETLWRNRLLTFKTIALLDRNGLVPEDESQAMWQRFLINLAKYRTASSLTDQVKEAILICGANGIVEDFSVLPRLMRDSMVIETWEGPHNTLCLQIVRDAMRSDLLDRWHSEVARALEHWPKWFLSLTRTRMDQAKLELEDGAPFDRLFDGEWAAANARRLVDRLGTLLELAWMGELASHLLDRSAALALLTSFARFRLLPTDRLFNHPILDEILENADSLIDETPFMADCAQI
jgi:alkylation response protein AidB-like acyl-CoA dehydrogenase